MRCGGQWNMSVHMKDHDEQDREILSPSLKQTMHVLHLLDRTNKYRYKSPRLDAGSRTGLTPSHATRETEAAETSLITEQNTKEVTICFLPKPNIARIRAQLPNQMLVDWVHGSATSKIKAVGTAYPLPRFRLLPHIPQAYLLLSLPSYSSLPNSK